MIMLYVEERGKTGKGVKEKKTDLTQSYDESPYTYIKFKRPIDNTETPPKLRLHNDADRLRTASWGNNSYPTGVVKIELHKSPQKSFAVKTKCLETCNSLRIFKVISYNIEEEIRLSAFWLK